MHFCYAYSVCVQCPWPRRQKYYIILCMHYADMMRARSSRHFTIIVYNIVSPYINIMFFMFDTIFWRPKCYGLRNMNKKMLNTIIHQYCWCIVKLLLLLPYCSSWDMVHHLHWNSRYTSVFFLSINRINLNYYCDACYSLYSTDFFSFADTGK